MYTIIHYSIVYKSNLLKTIYSKELLKNYDTFL